MKKDVFKNLLSILVLLLLVVLWTPMVTALQNNGGSLNPLTNPIFVFVLLFVLFVALLKRLFFGKSRGAAKAHELKAAPSPSPVSPAPPAPPVEKPQPQSNSEATKNYNIFMRYDPDARAYLAYSYEEKLAFPETSILTGNGGKLVKLMQEPENTHDAGAVAVFLGDSKVGYLHRGKVQDMANDWLRRDDPYVAHVNKIDVSNNQASIKIGFYKDIDALAVKKFKLTRITKKQDMSGGSRYENVLYSTNGDIVTHTSSPDNDNYVILDDVGNELGEVSPRAVEFIDNHEGCIEFMAVNNISKTDSGDLTADIEIFFHKASM